MFKFFWRLFKYAMITALGAAAAAKLLLESRAEPDTEEIDLVSIFEGTELVSSANPFYGGKILNWFAGTNLDLRKSHPAPTGIQLDVAILCGGLNIIVPEGWKVQSDTRMFGGGINDATRTGSDPDAITVYLTGFVIFGGVNVVARKVVEVVP